MLNASPSGHRGRGTARAAPSRDGRSVSAAERKQEVTRKRARPAFGNLRGIRDRSLTVTFHFRVPAAAALASVAAEFELRELRDWLKEHVPPLIRF